MADEHEQSPQGTPAVVSDAVTSAGADEPAVAGDDAPGADSDAPSDFEVQDAISETAIDETDDEQA